MLFLLGTPVAVPSHLLYGFILLGKWLESRARRATGAAIRALLNLAPRMARRIEDGQEVEVPAAAVAFA